MQFPFAVRREGGREREEREQAQLAQTAAGCATFLLLLFHSLCVLLGSFILQSGDTPKRCPGQMTNGDQGKEEKQMQTERPMGSPGKAGKTAALLGLLAICKIRNLPCQTRSREPRELPHHRGLPVPAKRPLLSLCSGIYSIRRSTIFMTELRFIASTSRQGLLHSSRLDSTRLVCGTSP